MKQFIPTILASLLLFPGAEARAAAVIGPELQSLLQTLTPEDEVSVLVTLTDQVDIGSFRARGKKERRGQLIRALRSKSEKTQQPMIALLRRNQAKTIRPFWIFNGLAVTAKAGVIERLAEEEGIASLRLDGTLNKVEPVPAEAAVPEWNIAAIGAPELWSMGYTGAGTVLAVMDTGGDLLHPDLASRWRGGANSWYDPNGEHATPYDPDGHGTGVLGIMVGGDAGGSSIGVAPDAQWIAVKMFNDAGSATYSGIHAGFQWLLDPDGDPTTDDAPDVVNGSWGFNQIAGQCFTEFQPDIQALKASEIGVVFSAGNGGPYPSTSESPANYPESVAVGAVDTALSIASYSSRGPSACDATVYPELVAPGASVRTTDLTYNGTLPDSYATVSGTSFAAPHVAGAMGLLLSADPDATIAQLEAALTGSALDLGSTGLDNDYGYGLLNVLAAYNLLSQNQSQCTDADLDGFYAESGCGAIPDCNDSVPGIHPGAEEIKYDSIDQDCNGYDLTIDIFRAEYSAKGDMLSVAATSVLGANAQLILEGYGPMKWNRNKAKWTIALRGAGGDPGVVAVSGIEGTESALTRNK